MNKKFQIRKRMVKPFWSWNDKLDKNELCRQINEMKNAGIEGFFMHARGGLTTEYMGEDWFDCIEACLDCADRLGMEAWAYDENGWPSGFANGEAPKKGVDFQQKMLKYALVENPETIPQNLIGLYRTDNGRITQISVPQKNCIAVYYSASPYYIDVFNKACIAYFIECTHQKYYESFAERFGSSLKGFFTDEPQFGNSGELPWSQVFPDYFREKYGYELVPELPLLFTEGEGSYRFRSDFFNMVSTLFREAFIKQMYDWCTAHNCRLTGHMMNEQSLTMQMQSTAGVMSCYEYFHEPGVDWLGREIGNPLVPKQLGSVASQLGKETISESFALCGWDVSLNELKWMAQWQMVNGVTSFCPHLEAYSLMGYRKRDYPPSFIHLPWFKSAHLKLSDYICKIGGILDDTKDIAPLLVIHPLESAYLLKNPQNTAPLYEYDEEFSKIITELSENHILYHFGDETVISHHGRISENTFEVGNCTYSAVLLPGLIGLTSFTVDLLTEFAKNGGIIYSIGDIPRLVGGRESFELKELSKWICVVNDVPTLKRLLNKNEFADIRTKGVENGNIEYCSRVMPDGDVIYYLTNRSDSEQRVMFSVRGELPLSFWDIETDNCRYAEARYNNGRTSLELLFAPYGSYILKTCETARKSDCKKTEKLVFDNIFKIAVCSPNSLTLDSCEYRVDNGEWQPEKAIIALQNELLEKRRPCNIDLKFRFEVEDLSACAGLNLCLENPSLYKFTVNGKSFIFKDNGFFIDKAIRSASIADLVKVGINEVVLSGEFYQSEYVYKVLFDPRMHDTERNKLTYNTELESIYITGDFCTESKEQYSYGERRSIFGGRQYSIKKSADYIDISSITENGYWFFSGEMELTQSINVSLNADTRYLIALKKLNAPAAKVYVNGKEAGILAFAPFELDVTELLQEGANTVTFKLMSGNRNLLGPHHKPYGESYSVGPSTFTNVVGWTDPWDKPAWTDNYNFVLFGVDFD
ncbi:MAG: hypothetical protein ACI4F7_08630 [Acutalibacteraceae bacterium]